MTRFFLVLALIGSMACNGGAKEMSQPAAPSVLAAPITYTVVKGDTIWNLARRFHINQDKLEAENAKYLEKEYPGVCARDLFRGEYFCNSNRFSRPWFNTLEIGMTLIFPD